MYNTRCCGLASGISRFGGPSVPYTLKHCIHRPFGQEMGSMDGIMIPELSMCETRKDFSLWFIVKDKEDCIYDNSLTGKKKVEDPSQTLNP
jgi:hypothetical protein